MSKAYVKENIKNITYIKLYSLTEEGHRKYKSTGNPKSLVDGKDYELVGTYDLQEFERMQEHSKLEDIIASVRK